MTRKRARFIFSAPMSVDSMSHPRIPGGHVSPGWRGMVPLWPHASQNRPERHLFSRPAPRPCGSNGPGRFAGPGPMCGRLQPVRDQDHGPLADQYQKSHLGAACFDAEKAQGVVVHHPQTDQYAMLRAPGLVHGIDLCTCRLISDLLIIRHNRLRDAIDTLLHGLNGYGEAEHGLAKVLHSPARATLSPA